VHLADLLLAAQGCGLITMGSHEEASNAIEALDNKHVWPGMDSPMVVKWMDAQLQKRRREEHLAAMRQGLIPSMGMGAPRRWPPPIPPAC
jgi:CUG-BP- and ETR3-like factor